MDTNRNKITEKLTKNNGFQEFTENDLDFEDFLYKNLEQDNIDGFSLGFSKNIIRKIEAKQQRRFNFKIYFLFGILLLISIPFFIIFFNKDAVSLWVFTFLKYKFAMIFLLASVIFIQLNDRFLKSKNF